MEKLLEINGLKSWYGLSQALFDVNLEINQGEVVALLGRNGMGNRLQHHGFTCLRRRHNQPPLTFTDWRSQINNSRGNIFSTAIANFHR